MKELRQLPNIMGGYFEKYCYCKRWKVRTDKKCFKEELFVSEIEVL